MIFAMALCYFFGERFFRAGGGRFFCSGPGRFLRSWMRRSPAAFFA
jgi:hypothetical protein